MLLDETPIEYEVVLQLTDKERQELERLLQWPEDLEKWDKLNKPTNLTEISF